MKQEKSFGITGVVLLIISAFMVAVCGTAISQPAYQGNLEQKQSALVKVNRFISDLKCDIKGLQNDLADLVMIEQMYGDDPLSKDYSEYNCQRFDDKLREHPLLLYGGDLEIGNLNEFMAYRQYVKDRLSKYAYAGITLETLQRDLESNMALRDRLEEEIAMLEGANAPQPTQPISYPLEGRWICPDLVYIDVRYFPEQGYFAAEIIDHKLKYFSKMQHTALFVVYSVNGKPNVYQGTEFGYNDAGGEQQSPLVLTVSEDDMTYRNPDQTLTFSRVRQ
jgi:hypothetical protein